MVLSQGYLLIIVIAIAIVVSVIYSIVSRVSPDYQIGMITSYTLSDDIIESFESYLEQYADDRNGDGQVVVRINQYTLGNADEMDPNELQASIVRFTADSSSVESVIFLHDETGLAYFGEDTLEGYFNYTDGTAMPEGVYDYENAMYDWSEISALAQYQPPAIEDYYSDVLLTSEDILSILQRYRVSIRAQTSAITRDDDRMSYYQDSMEFFERLRTNQTYEAAE